MKIYISRGTGGRGEHTLVLGQKTRLVRDPHKVRGELPSLRRWDQTITCTSSSSLKSISLLKKEEEENEEEKEKERNKNNEERGKKEVNGCS